MNASVEGEAIETRTSFALGIPQLDVEHEQFASLRAAVRASYGSGLSFFRVRTVANGIKKSWVRRRTACRVRHGGARRDDVDAFALGTGTGASF